MSHLIWNYTVCPLVFDFSRDENYFLFLIWQTCIFFTVRVIYLEFYLFCWCILVMFKFWGFVNIYEMIFIQSCLVLM